jgi:hypothetical protein
MFDIILNARLNSPCKLTGETVQQRLDITWETPKRDIPRLKLQWLDLLAREDPLFPR